MKILKIELQNINSLKSDSPIVIDFENEHFKDVGLYAITGSTGAGKTTILDAVTIALYHSVPRFNGTKGSLLDVVSYGATGALSRVTFENENVNYEAFWGIRLASSAGRILTNPQEEVSLKNLTTNTILASQKRAVISDVIRVTQLDYEQFLRSVMLAQGEFASFLTAKGPDKGRLLEQITGDQIYKKIGQGILDRKSLEENKLKEIQSRINSDDVLSEERNIELTQKDKELDIQIVASEKGIASINIIVDWHQKSHALTHEYEKLNKDAIEVNGDFENHKTEFQLLDLNEKAEPFKELIQNFNRNEKSSLKKSIQLKTLEEQLSLLKPEVERLTELSNQQLTELENANQTFNDWQPKFELVTRLDGELKNEATNRLNSKTKQENLNLQMRALQKDQVAIAKELAITEENIKSDKIYVLENKFLIHVASEISNWTTSLTTLKGNKETLNDNSLYVSLKKKEVENTKYELKENKAQLTKETVDIALIETEVGTINSQLSKNKLTDLLAEKEKLSETEFRWKQFKSFSEEKAKKEKELALVSSQKKSFSTDLESVKKQLEAVKKHIETQESSVTDAERILDLEKSISKYEDDRQKLIAGEPCRLCGSEEHPFTEHLESVGVPKSEIELKARNDSLKKLIDSRSQFDRNEVELTTRLDSLTKQVSSITNELKSIQLKATPLNIDCDLTNLTRIDSALNKSFEKLKLLGEQITSVQLLQTKKEHLLDTFKERNQSVEILKTKDATLSEKIKNTLAEIETKQNSITAGAKVCTDLEMDLKMKLSTFNYELPTIANTTLFIKSVEVSIDKFNKIQKNLDALKAETKVLDNQISNIKKQLETHAKTQIEYTKVIQHCDTKSTQLRTDRIAILPMDVTVESKRKSLQFVNKHVAEKFDLSKKELQGLLDTQREKQTVKVENSKEQKTLKDELDSLQSLLDAQVEGSGFQSRLAIEKALLPKEDKKKHLQNKDRITKQKVRLQALTEANAKAKDALIKTKNFETSETESKLVLEDLNLKNKDFLSEKGKVSEAFRKDQEIKDRNQEVYKKIEIQTKICGVWRELFKIIGNSKDAFNVYVQRLTLKHLLDLANLHLYKLNKRYSLKMEETYKPKEELNFNLIDHYQTDQSRLVDTSSGGEKFIISLALALGLSDLASKNVKIDSLFIDEGFGTLDSNTLETVISTLETLQSQGKMIGIISHVENLKERIPTQIQITKKSNGVSVVDIL